MSVSHIATGSKSAGGTTTVSIGYPSGILANRLAVAYRCGWESAITFTDETGWTSLTSLPGGSAGAAADNHTSEIRADYQILVGSESGSVTFDQGGTDANSGCIGVMGLYESTTASWDIAAVFGTDDTHGANRSVTASSSVSLAPGDLVVAVAAVDTDTSLASFASPAITASGITFGTTTRQTSGGGVNTGRDGNIEVFDAQVSSGTGTAAPVLAFTTTTSQCGPVCFVRLRSPDANPPSVSLMAPPMPP